MNFSSKEEIKNRMMKRAARLWKIPVNEVVDSLDPLITLLFSACASELEKLSGVINDSHARITERLIQLMAPLSAGHVKPAHAIAYCESVVPKSTITPGHQFYCRNIGADSKRDLQSDVDVYFTPTTDTTIIDARINYLVAGNKLFRLTEKKSKELIEIVGFQKSTSQTTLYLGLECDSGVLDLNQVSFYFEHLGISDADYFYYHLQHATWSLGDQKINSESGYAKTNESKAVVLDEIIKGNNNKATSACSEINDYYRKHFISLNMQDKITDSPKYEVFKGLSGSAATLFNSSKIFWLKVDFSSVVSSKTLEQLFCSINAFPVINRRMHQFSYQMKNFIDLIPIISETPFFEIQSIENTVGQIYKNIGTQVSDTHKGSYVLKNTNMTKLDSRNAKEYLSYVIELIKDESAAFQFNNHEFLQNDLNVLNQKLAVIEKKIEEAFKHERYCNYVDINPFLSNEHIKISYWTTNGEEANDIKSRQVLEVDKNTKIKAKNAYMLTSVFGGRHHLNDEQRLETYRRVALTQNKIVTEADVKAVCYDLYDKNINSVVIKKGVTTDFSIQKGITPCIEISLTASEESKLKPEEWNYLNNSLKNILEKQSTNVFPYKIIYNA